MPVMADHFEEVEGKPHRVNDGQVNLGLAVDVEKKDGSRTLMVPVIRDAGRLRSRLPRRLRRAGGEGAYEHADRRRPRRREHHADQPGRTRHGRIRPAPDDRTGHDRRDRLDRLPRRARQRRREIGAEKVMTMTSTYDHRIIQGAESGRFLALIEEYLQGEHDFYGYVFASLGVELGPAPAPPAPSGIRAAAPATGRAGAMRNCCARSRWRARSSAAFAATATWPHAWTRSARARGRPGSGSGATRPDTGDPGADPGARSADVRSGRHAGRRPAASA